jgi:L-seryl-tRNA(Ser) seleniumtransferase
MEIQEAAGRGAVLKQLPSVDEVLRLESVQALVTQAGIQRLTRYAREAVADLRAAILDVGRTLPAENVSRNLLTEAESLVAEKWNLEQNSGLNRVINATGVVVHTNLGRAPLSESAKASIAETASGYCTLEYDLASGRRGPRGGRAEKLLAELTGAESAVIVNNCAAAAFLVLTVLASGGEVVISRGELVEIGGDFRIPDVFAQAGATLREVGTTNRTKLADYECAIGEATRLVLKVHPSNYRIVGFTSAPTIAELAGLAHGKGILLYEDAGSGALLDLSALGLRDEPVISGSISAGADVVTFSGDKLLGGPQAGLIVGRREVIDRVRRHPLYRALRADKLAYAALEATLESYAAGMAAAEIPVLRMLSASAEELRSRVSDFSERLMTRLPEGSDLNVKIGEGVSAVGGGSGPDVQPPTVLLLLESSGSSAEELERRLRGCTPPVITRIVDGRVAIDLRTVSGSEEGELLGALLSAAANVPA